MENATSWRREVLGAGRPRAERCMIVCMYSTGTFNQTLFKWVQMYRKISKKKKIWPMINTANMNRMMRKEREKKNNFPLPTSCKGVTL